MYRSQPQKSTKGKIQSKSEIIRTEQTYTSPQKWSITWGTVTRKDRSTCLGQSPLSKSFLSTLEVQHTSSWPAHDTHTDIHLACWKFVSKAESVCRGSYFHSYWKMWNSEVVVAPTEVVENSADVNTCSVLLFSASTSEIWNESLWKIL